MADSEEGVASWLRIVMPESVDVSSSNFISSNGVGIRMSGAWKDLTSALGSGKYWLTK